MQLAMQVLVLNQINLPYDKYDYKHYHCVQISIVFSPFVVFMSSVSMSDRREWDDGTGVDLFGPTFSERMQQANAHARVDNWCMRAYFLYLIIS